MIIDGKSLAQDLKNDVKEKIESLNDKPILVVIKVGNNPASEIYVKNKEKACEEVGIISIPYNFKDSIEEEELLNEIYELNQNDYISGILVQLPLPEHINETKILESISPTKDVDGFHPYNIGKLLQREPGLRPCTPYGVIKMLKSLNVPLEGLRAAVVGASSIVGRPMALELLLEGITPTIINSKSKNIDEIILNSDIVISCVGIPKFVKGSWIKEGAIVIDIGINRDENGKLCGDVEFEEAQKKASFITPVPGGVGPMTVAVLMENTLKAAKLCLQ